MSTTTAPAPAAVAPLTHGLGSNILYLVRRYPLGVAGLIIMTVFVFAAIFAGWVAPLDPFTTNPRASLAAPGEKYLMGADMMGRDVFSRMIHGARISLAVAIGATLIGSGCGAALGLASGYVGGWFDLIVQRVAEIMQSLPLLVMALVITASLGPSLTNTIIAIAIPLIPNVARVIRSNVLSLREMPFVEAAKATGMSEWRIAIRHVLPNTLAPLIVLAAPLKVMSLPAPPPEVITLPFWVRLTGPLNLTDPAVAVYTAPFKLMLPPAV